MIHSEKKFEIQIPEKRFFLGAALILIPIASVLAACSPMHGKNVFNPNDMGINTGVTPGNGGTGSGAITSAHPEPFPDDPQKLDQAWERPDTSLVIDCYQGNSINWNEMATDHRVVGIIHRATIGMNVDRQFKPREAIAHQYGYLWGGYHLGRPGDPVAQAQLYLKTLGDPQHDLMVLDLEDITSSSFMNAADAKVFMDYVYQHTGRVPVVYANHNTTRALNAALGNDPLFKGSRLWYARFRPSIPDFPVGLWPTYFLWQFSSEINCSATGQCPYNVPGTTYRIDVNVFYGGKAALAYEWES